MACCSGWNRTNVHGLPCYSQGGWILFAALVCVSGRFCTRRRQESARSRVHSSVTGSIPRASMDATAGPRSQTIRDHDEVHMRSCPLLMEPSSHSKARRYHSLSVEHCNFAEMMVRRSNLAMVGLIEPSLAAERLSTHGHPLGLHKRNSGRSRTFPSTLPMVSRTNVSVAPADCMIVVSPKDSRWSRSGGSRNSQQPTT